MTDWMKPGNTAVVTGAAGGIGLEAARRYAAAGMNIVVADVKEELGVAEEELAAITSSPDKVLAKSCDVSKLEEVEALRDAALDRFGKVHCLMNNAGIGRPGSLPWEDLEQLHTILGVNLMGVVHGCHAFVPSMLAHGEAGAVINTGSKQGITRPPGNYAYNISKASVLAYTESITHAFRGLDNCALTAHLLIPGFVYTPMISGFVPQKPPGAATAEETVGFMLSALENGDFYILCPDNETPRELDEKRMQWTADDMIKNRPALSRWHPDFSEEFEAFVKG